MPPLRITPSARVSVVGSGPGPDVHGHRPLFRSHSAGRELTRTLVTAKGRGCLMRGWGLGAGVCHHKGQGQSLCPLSPRALAGPVIQNISLGPTCRCETLVHMSRNVSFLCLARFQHTCPHVHGPFGPWPPLLI